MSSTLPAHRHGPFATWPVCILGLALIAGPALAQNGRPEPQLPQVQTPAANPQPAVEDVVRPEPNNRDNQQVPPGATNRAPGNGNATGPVRKREPLPGRVTIAFNNAPVDDKVIGFIADNTGKVVIPINLPALQVKKITLINLEPIERAEAMDLVFSALRYNGVGIIEFDDVIVMDDLESIRNKRVPVYAHDQDIMGLTMLGNFIVKIYRLHLASADNVGAIISEVLPTYATLSIDTNSNQIILYGDVGLAQHYQRMIAELDTTHVTVQTMTWRLAYADATAISNQIFELFEDTGTGVAPAPQRAPQPRPGRPGQPQPRGGAVTATPSGVSSPGPVVELRVSVNVQQNSVTASAEPSKIRAIDALIREKWDLPRELGTFRVYTLQHTDPLKMRDLISNLMGGGTSARVPGARAGGAQAGRVAQMGGAAGGGGAGVSDVMGDIYRVEANPDSNSIVVISKTKEALDYLDEFIAANDQPSYIGLPHVVELKHAYAVSLADELNVLLAETGAGGGFIERPASGLTAEGPSGMSSTSSAGTTGGGRAPGGTTGGAGAPGGAIQFPWQTGRAREDISEPSPLIGKVRIVPIVRQNALAVLAPISQRQAIVELIERFDRPGRQVMISAVIAEVQLNDNLALGLRFSSSGLTPTSSDNAIGGSVGMAGSKDGIFGNLFTTSVLDVDANITVLLEALRQKTNVRIIQEPRVFTADNQEAAFFDGQEVPFITNSSVNQVGGGLVQSFDYKNVGVLLNVRPRITVQRDVDMEVRLELSAVVPGQTLFGGAILDRRVTTTKVIVKNAQTIVLSGLLRDVENKTTRGVPLLSDIPIIGELFKSRSNTKTTSELIAFITPIVVDNPSENDDNFNRLERERLRDMSIPLSKERVRDHTHAVREKIITAKDELGLPLPDQHDPYEEILNYPEPPRMPR